MIKLITLVPLFPLIGFVINGLFGKKLSKGLSGGIACGAVLASFAISLLAFFELNASGQKIFTINVFDWISSGSLSVPFEFLVDQIGRAHV